MSKKIEPGCRAVIVCKDSRDNGKIVEVISLHEKSTLAHGIEIFNIDTTVSGDDGRPTKLIGGKLLKRIDDYDGRKKTSWSVSDIWTPHGVTVNN